MTCCKCGKPGEYEPTPGQLMFGGFPVRREVRCQKCEDAVIKRIESHLKQLNATIDIATS